MRLIIEANDHRLYMTSTFIKPSGLGVCAAPACRTSILVMNRSGINIIVTSFRRRHDLSENPQIAFDDWINGAGRLRVRTEDTRHAVFEQSFPIGSSS